MEIKIDLTTNEQKDLKSYCKLNELDETEIVKKSYLKGFKIEKYGLLGNTGGVQEKQVVKEVIVEKRVEIPVEVIKEVVKIEYVEVPVDRVVEKIVEITKEVPVDRVVEKIVEVIKEVPVEKVVIKEVIKEIPIETVVTKTEYVSDDSQINELLLKIQQMESDKQLFSTKTQELEEQVQIFSTKTDEMENIFQNKMSKKDEELDELRRNLDIPVTNNKINMLQDTLQNLRNDLSLKNDKINELEKINQELQKTANLQNAIYMKGSNLNSRI